MKKSILFIINPISGVSKKNLIQPLIEKHLDKELFEKEIVYTKAPKHATKISKEANNKYNIVIIIGGDGSINEAFRGLIYSQTIFGIIPIGSGNGLARHLNIPLDMSEAIKTINKFNVEKIDTLIINTENFINVGGVGFDAFIAHKFAVADERGFNSYLKIILKSFISYKSKNYQLVIDGKKKYEKDVFMLSFANASQFGNEGYIAPLADISDGEMDICILKSFPIILAPLMAYKLAHKKINTSRYYHSYKAKEVILKNNKELKMHIDGDPVTFNDDVKISILPKSINIITG